MLITILQYCNDAIFTINDNYTYGFVNQTFANLLDLNTQDFINKTPLEVLINKEANEQISIFKNVFETGIVHSAKIIITCHKDNVRHFHLTAAPVKNNQTMSIVVSAKDITEEVLECQKHKKASDALENYMHTINHDLRNPLWSIISFSSILKDDNVTDEERAKLIEMIYECSKNMFDMIENYMLFIKAENGNIDINMKPEKIFVVVDEIKKLLKLNDYKNVVLNYRNPENMASNMSYFEKEIMVNKKLLLSMLSNLLNNAVEAVSQTDEKVVVNIFQNDCFEISITNAGSIPPQIEEKLFQKYNTSKKKGNGIGLYSAKLMANAHGGELLYKSLPNATRFTLKLPFLN